MARLVFPSRLELNRREGCLQRGSPGECHLHHVLVGLSRADDPAVGPDRSSRRRRFFPLPLFDDPRYTSWIRLARSRERLSRASPEFLIFWLIEAEADFAGRGLFMPQAPTSSPGPACVPRSQAMIAGQRATGRSRWRRRSGALLESGSIPGSSRSASCWTPSEPAEDVVDGEAAVGHLRRRRPRPARTCARSA